MIVLSLLLDLLNIFHEKSKCMNMKIHKVFSKQILYHLKDIRRAKLLYNAKVAVPVSQYDKGIKDKGRKTSVLMPYSIVYTFNIVQTMNLTT